jgi:glycosyltransferase involved in cell wall biosynthesis
VRVCIVADSASVRFGGEAILPYHYFRLLSARGVETWLVVHDRTRGELEALLPEYRDRMIFARDTRLNKIVNYFCFLHPSRLMISTLGLLNVMLTQRELRRLVRELVRRERIDIIHQPTPVSPKNPSLIFNLGAPVVIGPLNGGMDYPSAFRGQESWFSHVAMSGARGLSNLVNRILPGKRRAATLLVANPRTREALPKGVRGKVVELVENAVELETWNPKAGHPELAPIAPVGSEPTNQFVFLGRLVDWKRLDILLSAMVKVPEATLAVIGDGEMRVAWEHVCRDLKIEGRVSFLGWQSHTQCAEALSRSVALVLPSVYECGGAVVLEAMAAGRPVIATNWGGPADYLDESCGILVNPDGYSEMVDRIADAMILLLGNRDLADRMGMAGRLRVQQHFTWQGKIDRIQEVYAEAIEATAERSPASALASSR